ncbi:universal stress protein [Gordonia soli]|uniref:UspA domain-containing protein n=1 Tax=Gordonia soli NBRC 108243 TaxID=1223545 RepID=M0QNV4_9ACTN|nr:universal stress protein [Gordonia soli]GAC70089.1 hypothetical protein GS4_32_00330 [Gordonia soli NBRC 108243]
MSTIAVGVDASIESEAAARWAAAVADRGGHRVVLVHGYAPPMMIATLAEYDVDSARAAAHDRVAAVADALHVDHPSLDITTIVEHLTAIPLLTNVSEHADVLVLGHHRAGWFERLTAGSISSALSARSRCPVVTVPYGNLVEHGPVVAAVDVEAPSEHAITAAFDRARDADGRITILCAIPDDLAADEIAEVYRRADALLDTWRELYPDCTVTLQLVNGNPHRALAEAVPQAALLVITRPRGGAGMTAWTTSVARAVHHSARCPIAIVDHAAESA